MTRLFQKGNHNFSVIKSYLQGGDFRSLRGPIPKTSYSAIRWKQFLERCRLRQLKHSIRNEDSILYRKYERKCFGIYIMKILTLRVFEENAFRRNTAVHNKELIKSGFSATVV